MGRVRNVLHADLRLFFLVLLELRLVVVYGVLQAGPDERRKQCFCSTVTLDCAIPDLVVCECERHPS